jgi:hypothetical protein
VKDNFCQHFLASLGERGLLVHDTWRAYPSPHGLVFEIGAGGDVGIGGLS